ncbi:aminotransferase class V-fold PLP-dependent enzyme [Paenibacillus mesotrionivorans]|uniref:Aminotransferase class V-fold PLP-dependent enzyme n=1 Tax=Paenibacillus mesotrionivorans TaxID=3160968 RepID=A0ACC7P5U2_9BACL
MKSLARGVGVLIYLDNAATSWPKPPQVTEAMVKCMQESAANPGRGGHQMAVQASRILFQTRVQLAKLFHIRNANDIAFAANTTEALNLAIKGYVKPGMHVISTTVEHNSIRRPLEYLVRKLGIEVTYLQTDRAGRIRLEELEKEIRPHTGLIAVTHSSNLLGTIQPVAEIGSICKRKGIRFLVDAAQSAGILPVDVENMNIDLLAFPGHKGLLGPQGTGGLYIHPDVELEPLHHGGTGSQSEAVDQPQVRPDRYESGTQNTPGIAGLGEGVKFVLREGVDAIHAKESRLVRRMMEGLMGIEGVELLGPEIGEPRTGIVAFRLADTDPSEVAFILDQSFQIAVRAGYHCTPLAHQSAGTTETGALRASVGYFSTDAEVDALIGAVKEIRQGL